MKATLLTEAADLEITCGSKSLEPHLARPPHRPAAHGNRAAARHHTGRCMRHASQMGEPTHTLSPGELGVDASALPIEAPAALRRREPLGGVLQVRHPCGRG